jgi:GR25 family glycosyltransferase involved in LPS biosynthesis
MDKIDLFYINLDHRTDRNDLMIKNWEGIVSLNRVQGTIFPEHKFGTAGCYESHRKILKMLFIEGISTDAKELCIISEDDIIPSQSFNDKLEVILSEIPRDWDVLMLGYSISERSKYNRVSNNIAKANENVLSGTCYIVNPKFYELMLEEYKKVAYGQDLDAMLMVIQKKFNVYMAMPSLCYQYQSYSDNSKMVLDNTKMTEAFFLG